MYSICCESFLQHIATQIRHFGIFSIRIRIMTHGHDSFYSSDVDKSPVKTFARQCVRIPVSARHVGSMEKRAALLRAVKSRKPGTCYWLWHTTWKDCLNLVVDYRMVTQTLGYSALWTRNRRLGVIFSGSFAENG